MNRLFFLVCLIIASCTKPEICGEVTGGDYDRFTGQPYLKIDGQKEYVDQITFNSFYIGDYVCLQ